MAELDGNGDGRIDASDAAFANLRVWRDTDQDGLADASELRSLEEAVVLRLDLTYANSTLVDANAHRQMGRYARTVDRHPVEVSAAIAALPEIAGFGNVPGLRQGMARDGSGQNRRWQDGKCANDEAWCKAAQVLLTAC